MNNEVLDSEQFSKKEKRSFLLNIFEIVAITVAIAGYVFKKLHWAGASQLLLIGFAAILFLYLFLFKKLVTIPNDNFSSSFIRVVGLLLGVSITILLFRLLLWPGLSEYTWIGYPLILLDT